MYLLVPACDVSVLIDPNQSVLDFLALFGWLVDTHADGEFGGASCMLEAKDEGTGRHRSDQQDSFQGGGGYVVGRFREEESLNHKGLCW